MRKIGELMTELGFNKDSSTETQKAFVKHLFKAAYGFEIREPGSTVIPHQKPFPQQAPSNGQAQRPSKKSAKAQPEQLSFTFEKDDGAESA